MALVSHPDHVPSIGELPYRVSIFALRRPDFQPAADAAGDARESHTEIVTYWIGDTGEELLNVARVITHLHYRQREANTTGWDLTWGPIGLSWAWIASRRAYRDVVGGER